MKKTNIEATNKYNIDSYSKGDVCLNTDERGEEEVMICDGLGVFSIYGDCKDILLKYISNLSAQQEIPASQCELSTIPDSGMVSESFVLELMKTINNK